MQFLKRIFPVEFFILLITFTGWYVLITPDNLLTRHFRRNFESLDQRVIIGPYPSKEDFPLLIDNHVKVIISLLNPEIPYESKLIMEERENALASGIQWVNFPMSSVLGHRFGEEYEKNAEKAAQFINEESGKTYLHCYLGKHRVESVREILNKKGLNSGLYPLDRTHKNTYLEIIEQANTLYEQRRYEEAYKQLSLQPQLEWGSDAKLIAGWSKYHLSKLDESKDLFDSVLSKDPSNSNALLGSGLVFLKIGELEMAEARLKKASQIDQNNTETYEALGLLSIQQGQIKQAKSYLKRSIDLDSSNKEAAEALEKLPH